MQYEELNTIRIQIQNVIDIVKHKKNQKDHKFLDTLLDRLQGLLVNTSTISDINELKENSKLKGALRGYFDTNLIESYDEPLVIELDKLETMLNRGTNK